MNYSDSLCDQAKSIVTGVEFRSIFCLEIVIGLSACCINCIVISLIWRVTVFHANLRCLLIYHSINLALFGLSTAVKAIFFGGVGLFLEKPCLLVTSLYQCRLQELINIVPLLSAIYGLVALSLERLYATIRYRSYDSSRSTPWLAIVLLPLICLIIFFNQLWPLKSIPNNFYLPVCASLLTMPPNVAGPVLAQNLCLNLLSIFLAITLHVINKRKLYNSIINRAQHSLGARFQISQNVSVAQLLLPSIIAHIGFTLPSAIICMLLTNVFNKMRIDEKFMWIHIVNLWGMCSSLLHPILALTRNPHLKKLFLRFFSIEKFKCWRNAIQPMPITMKNVTDAHFKTLHDMWSKKH